MDERKVKQLDIHQMHNIVRKNPLVLLWTSSSHVGRRQKCWRFVTLSQVRYLKIIRKIYDQSISRLFRHGTTLWRLCVKIISKLSEMHILHGISWPTIIDVFMSNGVFNCLWPIILTIPYNNSQVKKNETENVVR